MRLSFTTLIFSFVFSFVHITLAASENVLVCTPITNNVISASATICNGAVPAQLTGTNPSGGAAPYTYLWLQSSNGTTWAAATGVNNASTYNPPALFSNTFYRRLVISDPSCTEKDTSASILITVVNLANAGANQIVCGDSTSLFGNAAVVGTGTWTLLSGAGNFQNVNSPTTAVTFMNTGLNKFIWTINSGICPASSDTVTVDSYKPATKANAGFDNSICATSFTLSANTPAFGTGSWNLVSPSSPSLSSLTLPNAVVSGLLPGQNVLEWVISTTVCPASRDTVIITVFSPPSTANAGNNFSICGDSTTLSATTPTTGTGLWTVISGTANFLNSSSPLSSCNGISTGNTSLLWTVSNGVCPSSSDTLVIQSFQSPSAADAGVDQEFCNVTGAVLAATSPVIGSGAWIALTNGPIVTNPLLPNSTVSGLVPGVNVFQWQITNGVCPPSLDTIVITMNALPSPVNAGSDQTICGSVATLNATTPIFGTGTWSVLSGSGTLSSANSPVDTVSGMTNGMNSFVWTVSNGNCPPASDTIQINVQPAMTTPNAGADQTICAAAVTLSANSPSVGVGNWISITPGSSIASPSSATTSATGLSIGQNLFEWVISSGQCTPLRDTVVITVDANPSAANAGNDQAVCGDTALLSATAPLIGSGVWSVSSGAGSFTGTTNPASVVLALNPGTNVLIWTTSNGTVCPSSSDTVIIQSLDLVSVAVAGTDQFLCAPDSVQLGATLPTNGTGAWNVLTSGVILSNTTSASTTATALIAGQNIFEWVVSNGACPDSRDTVIVDITPLPTNVNAGTDQNVCGDSTFFNASTPSAGVGSWALLTGAGNIASVNSAGSFVSSLGAGQNIFIWSVVNGICPAVSDTLIVSTFGPVTTSNAGNDQSLCAQTSSTINANLPVSGSGTWSVVSGSAVVANPSSPGSVVNSLQNGNNLFVWTVSNGACPDSRDTINIHVYPLPSPANAGTDQSVCGNTVTLGATAPIAGTGNWSVLSGAATFLNSNLITTTASGLNTGDNLLLWTVSSGVCPSNYDTVLIHILPSPSIAVAGVDSEICAFDITLSGSIPVEGTGTWYLISGGGSIAQPGAATTLVTAMPPGQNIFEWVISNGICPDSRDTIVVTAYALPTIANAGPDINTDLSTIQLAGNSPTVGTGAWTIFSGQGTLGSPTNPNSYISNLVDGSTTLVWTITNGVCPSSSDTMNVYYSSLLIPEVITPNGDGKNDFFEIKAFKGIGGIKLDIFNRWGGKVYSSENYQHDFDGHNLSQKDLADDTYYYVMILPDERTFNGFLLIKRK